MRGSAVHTNKGLDQGNADEEHDEAAYSVNLSSRGKSKGKGKDKSKGSEASGKGGETRKGGKEDWNGGEL